MARVSGYDMSLQQLSHLLHLSSYLLLSCGESLGLGSSQVAAQQCFAHNKVPLHSGISVEHYQSWVQSDPDYLTWIPTLYRLNISHNMKHEVKCGVCKSYPILGLRYKCLKCSNLDLCQECFLKGAVFKNHDETHPLKEYIRQRGIRSTSLKDLTSFIVKTSSQKSRCSVGHKTAKSTGSHQDSLGYETIATEEWFARKGRLPLQSPLQYTSCPILNATAEDFGILQQQNHQLEEQVKRLKQKVAMSSPPPYHCHSQSDMDVLTRQHPEYHAAPSDGSISPHHPYKAKQSLEKIADTFSTDLSLYTGQIRERHPVISSAGKIGLAMDSFISDMCHHIPPPKPKRTSPDVSKANLSPSNSSRDNAPAPRHSGVDLRLAFDPSNIRKPACILPAAGQTKPPNITSSTPKLPKKQILDISFTCSSVRGVDPDERTGDKHETSASELASTVSARSNSSSMSVPKEEQQSIADTSITRSINKVYLPPPLLLHAVESEQDLANWEDTRRSVTDTQRGLDQDGVDKTADKRSIGRNYMSPRNRISRNYRGSMDLSLHADSMCSVATRVSSR